MLSVTPNANAWERSLLLRCKTADYGSFSVNGLLEKNSIFKDEEFTVDLDTGMVRSDNASGVLYHIIQKGNDSNDTVLSRTVKSMADNIIRIRDWETNRKITFMKINIDNITTGICSPF